MTNALYGPHLLTEEDIPGSSLAGRKPSTLKNTELKFWLRCRGDSCKGLSTKAQLGKRYDIEYLGSFVVCVMQNYDLDSIISG